MKSVKGKESILLIDGWKNTAGNNRTTVRMLHSASGCRAFLDAWGITGTSETGDLLSEIVDNHSKLIERKSFCCSSDNASDMNTMHM